MTPQDGISPFFPSLITFCDSGVEMGLLVSLNQGLQEREGFVVPAI